MLAAGPDAEAGPYAVAWRDLITVVGPDAEAGTWTSWHAVACTPGTPPHGPACGWLSCAHAHE